jgi:hypothetical protein
MKMKKDDIINFLFGKKEGWTLIGKKIDKLNFLYFLPNEHRLSIFKCLIILW